MKSVGIVCASIAAAVLAGSMFGYGSYKSMYNSSHNRKEIHQSLDWYNNNIGELNSLYEKRDYAGISELTDSYNGSSSVLEKWSHYNFINIYDYYYKRVADIYIMVQKGEKLSDYQFGTGFEESLDMIYFINNKNGYNYRRYEGCTAEEKETVDGWVAEAQNYLKNVAKATDKEINDMLNELYQNGYYDYKLGKSYEESFYKNIMKEEQLMKCNNCGAPIQMNQKFCPNCGSPNVEFKKHIDDMEQYNKKKFNNTRSKVIGNSKWFVKYIAPITALVITMTALTLAIIGKNSMIGYDIARKNQQKYYSSHSDEIQTKLKLLLEAGDYATLYSMDYVGDCSIKDNDDKYAWNDFYNVAGDYVYIRKGIISMMERNNSSYYGDEYMNTISRAVADMEDIVSRRLNLSYHSVSKESIKYINDIYEKSHELLKAYCNLTDEDIAGLPDMSQADILTLITRRSFE